MKILTISSGGMPQRTLSMAGRGNALGMVFFLGVCAIVSPLLAVFSPFSSLPGPLQRRWRLPAPLGLGFPLRLSPMVSFTTTLSI